MFFIPSQRTSPPPTFSRAALAVNQKKSLRASVQVRRREPAWAVAPARRRTRPTKKTRESVALPRWVLAYLRRTRDADEIFSVRYSNRRCSECALAHRLLVVHEHRWEHIYDMKRSAQSFSFHLLIAKYFVFVRNGVREKAPVRSVLVIVIVRAMAPLAVYRDRGRRRRRCSTSIRSRRS